ncbi:MAG: ATP-binding protein, partial [Limnobacter sp.]|nr:ATP-binding protein [Limnobacter sp.]
QTTDLSKDKFIEQGLKSTMTLFGANRAFLIEADPDYQDGTLYLQGFLRDEPFQKISGFDTHQNLVQFVGSELSGTKVSTNGQVDMDPLFGQAEQGVSLIQNMMFCLSKESANRQLILGVAAPQTKFSQEDEQQIQLFLGDFNRLIVKTEVAEELKQAKASAEAASLAKRLFLANMSHEIRTPLNAIMGLNTLLLDEDMPGKHREMLQQMKVSSNHLLSILESILDFSRIDAGIVELERIEFQPEKEFFSTVNLFKAKAEQKGLTLTAFYEKEIPLRLKGDPTRFNQVVTNLLSNAIKFSTEGTVSVKLYLASEVENRVTLGLTVEDEGIGFNVDKLAHLLEPFEQADNSHARRFGGTGLGLAIVNKLINLMGGSLEVDSELGRGSSFKVTMQFDSFGLLTKQAQEPENRLEDEIDWAKRFNGQHILVVDDNSLNQTVVSALLERVNIHSTVASDGVEALKVLQSDSSIDLVLMDMHMPNMDGLEATRVIRQDFPKGLNSIKVIALTACATDEDQEKALSVGMDDYLIKPIDAKVLYATLDNHLRMTTG